MSDEPTLQHPKIQNNDAFLQVFLIAQGIRPLAKHRPTALQMLAELQCLKHKDPA